MYVLFLTQRSIAEVEWGTSGSRNIYRVGHKGKVDLKCDTPGDGGEYYPDHLPMSGGFCVVCRYTHIRYINIIFNLIL